MESNLKSRITTALLLTTLAAILLCLPEYFSYGGLLLQGTCVLLVLLCVIELGIMLFQTEGRFWLSIVIGGACIFPALLVVGMSVVDFFFPQPIPAGALVARVAVAGFLGLVAAVSVMVYGGKARSRDAHPLLRLSFQQPLRLDLVVLHWLGSPEVCTQANCLRFYSWRSVLMI
jgi:hypothetical protein